MARIVLFNKPYGVLSQFTPEGRWRALDEFIPIKGVYVAGRLDADSEGLLLLTDDGTLQHRIASPRHKLPKTYWAQVEGIPDEAALARLRAGVDIGDYRTQPCQARCIDEPPGLWQRDPPIRFRQSIPASWIELELREGKNRQVRRMCAAVGFPVLRLVRAAIGAITLGDLAPGSWRLVEGGYDLLAGAAPPGEERGRAARPVARSPARPTGAESAAKPAAKPARPPVRGSRPPR